MLLRQQEDARHKTSDDGCKSEQSASRSRREQQIAIITQFESGDRRNRRTTDVGTGGALPTAANEETRLCGDQEEQKIATASCGGSSAFRFDESAEQDNAGHQGSGTSIATAFRGTSSEAHSSHISASSSRPSRAPTSMIVPPAREAAFLKQQERASESEQTVGECHAWLDISLRMRIVLQSLSS